MRWRGSFEAAVHDLGYHALQIGPDVVGGNTQRLNPMLPRPRVAAGVSFGSVAATVRETVDLDGKTCRPAEEVQNIGAAGMLAAELQPIGSKSEMAPEERLRGRHASAKLACLENGQGRRTPPPASLVPLPTKSWGG